MQKFSFLPKVVVRLPLKKTETDITSEKIKTLLLDPKFQEALFVASPSFFGMVENEEQLAEKMLRTLYKYYSRLSNRCTPFGLFAAIGIIDTAHKTGLHLDKSTLEKNIRYDMLFLGMLNDRINQEKSIREQLKYYPNNTIYRILDNLRYVEFYYENDKRYHRIAEVEYNEHLGKILEASKNGTTITQLCKLLESPDISLKEANSFLHGIIDAQFLVSELDVILTGEDYLEHIISILAESRFNFPKGLEIKNTLNFLKNGLLSLEKDQVTPPTSYTQFFSEIKPKIKENNLEINKLFQVDTFKNLNGSTLGYGVLKKLRAGIQVLNKISTSYGNNNLKNFKAAFLNRYEDEMMPLCQTLDPDSGIGYTNLSGAKTPLLKDLGLIKKRKEKQKIDFDTKNEFLLKKIIAAYQNNLSIIQLKDEELNLLEEDPTLFTDSFSVFFSLFTENDDDKIFLKSAFGPSANNLIGRFGYLHEELLDISNEICAIEKKNNPNKILAEIVHLPEARTGNILHRKFQRDYEIPYLAKSSLDPKNQIHIDDLYVTVKNNRVILFSKALGKEIIPRLGNAHNYSYMALPIYNFLCDIQHQNASGFAFDWGSLASSFPFLPRVEYKGIILSKAQWNFQKEDVNALLSQKKDIVESVRSFAQNKKLPNILLVVEGDNEIIINFKNDLSCSVFYSMAKNRNGIVLQEFLMKNPTLTKGYANEFIAFGTKDTPTKSNTFNWEFDKDKSSFSIGSNWMYFKFYCGTSTAEDILKRAVAPIIDELREAKIIDKWFFIRFNDKDGHHLRLRIKVYDVEDISKTTSIVQKYLRYFTDPKIVWKVQMDTYKPETERYGNSVIEQTESAFQNDSECTLAFLDMIEGDEGEKIRWLFALLSIDNYLSDFGLAEKEKLRILREAKDGFGSEFNKDKSINKKVNVFYRDHQTDIQEMMQLPSEEHSYYPLLRLVEERSSKNRTIFPKIKDSLEDHIDGDEVIISHIHMICNRLFLTKQREHETVVYDLLYQYYRRKMFVKNI